MKLIKSRFHIILLALGIVGVLDTLFVLIYSSVNLGTILPGIVGAMLIAWSLAQLYFHEYLARYNLALIKKSMTLFFALWLVSFVVVESIIISSQSSDENYKVDYLLILGAGLRGEDLSLTLYNRMETGLNYLLKHPEVKVIVSGGKGPGEAITEAAAMKRFLILKGIEDSRIIKEESSTSTFENLKHSKQQLLNNDEAKVLIVTNDFHMFRAKLLAKRAGLIPYGLPSKTPPIVLVNCYLREYFAVIKSYFLDK